MRVLFIDIDTLRPDHMSCYGYHRKTTPNLDKVCSQGVRFDNYYTSDAPCLPSRASLISGMFGFRNGAVGHGGTAAERRVRGDERGFAYIKDEGCFHQIFRKAGMQTVSISTFPERHSIWWFNAGLNECHNVGKRGSESGEEVLPLALDWLERRGRDDDWYLHVHIWDPHTPYRAPESFGEPFENDPIPDWLTEDELELHKRHTGPHSVMETAMYNDKIPARFPRQPGKCEDMTALKKLIDGYDTGVLYADYLMGQVLDKLRELGVYDETAVIITSDHGENMGELGIYSEHATADKATCNIPMIIKWPGIGGGRSVKELHYSLDLLPTIAEMLDVEPSDFWDGISYKAELEGKDCMVCEKRDHLIVSQNAHVCQRSAIFGEWLYMRTVHDGYHLFEKEMLYNLAHDPHERIDVKDEHPEICARGAKYILDWIDEQMLKDPTGSDPMWTVMREGGPEHTKVDITEYIKWLRQTDRADGADILEARYLKKK